ncbi:MAG TPA: aspartyl protease family protein [Terriglobia bacterium]|nr:aspartyl protease family protein [Terriglobia bacterium]
MTVWGERHRVRLLTKERKVANGMFDVEVKLASLAAPGRTENVSLLVDTGATLSWIPRDILERLGAVVYSRLPFTLADGRTLERDTTAVLLTIDGRKAAVQVAFGELGEEAVLGATELEGLPSGRSSGEETDPSQLACSHRRFKSVRENRTGDSIAAIYTRRRKSGM